MNTINILNIKYCDIDIAEAVEHSMRAIRARSGGYVLTPDSALALAARKSRRLMAALRAARLILPGDRGIFIASRILGLPLHYKMSGADYASALLARLGGEAGSVYIIDAAANDLRGAAARLAARYPGLVIAGISDGRFVDDTELIDEINTASPDLLLVCMSSPRQELWLYETCPMLNAGLCLGLGRDDNNGAGQGGFFARLAHDPRRALKLPRIILAALWKRIAG